MQPPNEIAPQTYLNYIHQDFAPADWPTAEAVCMAESHCRSDAVGHNSNGSVDYGVFQVNSVHAGKVNGNLSALLDPATNVRVAAQIKAASGWSAWQTYKNQAYLKYLERH